MAAGCGLGGAWAQSAESTPLRFAELFQMPAGPRGLEPTARTRELSGQKVRITGYMVAQEAAAPGRFFLTPLPLRMSEHADGEADDLPPNAITVLMPSAQRAQVLPHTPGLLQLVGTLEYGRSVLDDGRVVWLRLLLDPPPGAAAKSPS